MMGGCKRLLIIKPTTNREEHEIATSLSGSPKLSKSWKSDAASFSILYTNFLPFTKKEEVVLHPERACAPGRTIHVISEREEHSS